ncbi:cupin domain-containing protein [Psychroserpens sp. XS_ASV72]|uniref:cupin domain-containing protein n=1 Tax=Psychroserpens sp. XS_ASV72 TaxID=3241293 RepID=UPI0035166FE9
MNHHLKKLITELDLKPHPEGGFFKETYRCRERIPKEHLSENYSGTRNYSTCIYFLLTSENFSAFHKINQDEIWHFYDGSPISLHLISEDGTYLKQMIGSDILNKQVPQFVVKAGSWFAAEIEPKDSYALIGCTVSPGFDFDDFQLAKRQDLLKEFPEHQEIISKLTHE